LLGVVGPGVGSDEVTEPNAEALSKYSRWSLVEKPTRAIHRFDIRFVAETSNPR